MDNVVQINPEVRDPALNDIVRVEVIFATTASSKFVGQCVLHYRASKVPENQPFSVCASELTDGIEAAWSGLVTQVSSVIKLSHIEVHGVTDKTASFSKTYDKAGSGTAGNMPAQCAALLSLYTAKAGRFYRGRNYWPGFGKAGHDGGHWDSSLVKNLQTFGNALRSIKGDTGTCQWEWGVYHVQDPKNPSGSPTTQINDVTNVVVRPIAATQRRRVDID